MFLIAPVAAAATKPTNPPPAGPVSDITAIVTEILSMLTGLKSDVGTLQTTMDDNFTAVDTSLDSIQEGLDTLLTEPGEVTSIRYVTGTHDLGSGFNEATVVIKCRNYGDTTATVNYNVTNSTESYVHDSSMGPNQISQRISTSVLNGNLATTIETDSPDIICWTEFYDFTELKARYMPSDYVVYKKSNEEWKRIF
jgi:hypothetical protein